MLIWIPVDGDNAVTAKVAPLVDVKKWALVNFDEGEVKSVTFYGGREEYSEWVDFIVLFNKFEPYIDFMNDGMMVLCVREEETIDEITEAFKFKELDEVGF
jgi:hypothetical protein